MDHSLCNIDQNPLIRDTDQVIIINMVHSQTEEDSWDTDQDSAVSVTSTPDFKRGKHGNVNKTMEPEVSDLLSHHICELIVREARLFKHATREKRAPSVHILADAHIQAWPKNDNICVTDYELGWSLKKWLAALRAGIITIRCHTVILYLEACHTYPDVPPLKNALQGLCKVIRQHQKEVRIFVANIMPKVSKSPVRPRVELNFNLLQAVRSVNRILKKIHFLSVYEHFVSKKGVILHPTHKYFQEDEQLTPLGCLIMRECLLREAGLKSYWF